MQKSLTRLFTAVLMAALLVSASIISVSAATAQPCDGNHGTGTAINNDNIATIDFGDGGHYYLEETLTTGIAIPAATSARTITLCLNGNNIEVTSGSAITVGNLNTLNLVNHVANSFGDDGKPTTGYISATGTQYALKVTATSTANKATVNMYDNVCISNCETTGAPVYVQRCEFNMEGGAISYNETTGAATMGTVSGGILLETSGTVNLKGGSIHNNSVTHDQYKHATANTSAYAGGGVATIGGTLNIQGDAAIFENYAYTKALKGGASGDKASYSYAAGGVCVQTGTLNMTGGQIAGNQAKAETLATTAGTSGWAVSAGGIYVNSSCTANISAGTIGGDTAVTVADGAPTNLGSDTGNYSWNGGGGGIALRGTVNLSDSAAVKNNYADRHTDGKAMKDYGGGGVLIWNGGTLNMSETSTITKNTSAWNGGGVYQGGTAAGTFKMTGGTISENTALTGGTQQLGHGGGGVTVKLGDFTMSSGTISENKATTSRGAGVYLLGGSFTMSGDATIQSNIGRQGGGIAANGSGITVTINGGEIKNNAVDNNGGAVALYGTVTFEMTGGTISGNVDPTNGRGVYVNATSSIEISGDAVIANNWKTANATAATADLYIGCTSGNGTAAIKNGSFGSMYVASTGQLTISGGRFGTEANDTLYGYLDTCKDPNLGVIVLPEGSDYAYEVAFAWSDCKPGGHDNWIAIYNSQDSATAAGAAEGTYVVPGDDGLIQLDVTKEGKYYLAENITSARINTADAAAPVDIEVCMNGFSSIVSSGSAGFRVGGNVTMNLCNCADDAGGIIRGYDGGGLIKGLAMMVAANGTAIMNDGVRISGAEGALADYGSLKAPVQVNGTFHMKGGEISYNKSDNGGAVCVNLAGAQFIMDDGVISHNQGKTGGGVYMPSGGKFIMNGGTISYNYATGNGGGIYATKSAQIFLNNDSMITQNTAASRGGGVYLTGEANADRTTLTMNGGTISYNKATTNGGGVFLYGSGTSYGTDLIMNDGIITENSTEGAANAGGGGVGTFGNSSVTMKKGEISKNKAGAEGGAVALVSNATFDMSGGTISGNTKSNDESAGLCLLTGGVGYIKISAGDVMDQISNSGTVTITGGKFSLVNDRDKLGKWLTEGYADNDGNTKVLSVKENADGTAYEVAEGFYSTGEYLEWGSSLGLGLYLYADVTPVGLNLTGTVSTPYTTAGVEAAGDDIAGYKLVAHGIAAKDMDKGVTFEVKAGDTSLFTKTTSIRDAAGVWAEDAGKATMVADMINYGIAAQDEFLGGATMEALTVSGSEGEISWTTDGIEVNGQGQVGVSLNLRERIELNIYVPVEVQALDSAYQDGEATEDYKLTNVSGYTRITFNNINVMDVMDSISLTVGEYSVTCSIADYVVQAIEANSQKALMQALQRYVESVITFMNNQ